MRTKDPRDWMWAEAMGLLQTAGRLQRQFFHVGRYDDAACWAPPVDIYETADGLWILVALPGVAPEHVSVAIDGAAIVVSGERPLPVESRRGAIHRLEIPYGRFERRIALPAGRFELIERELERGCLILGLRRLD
jgi:HSP20 family molecular chaperone IbpA